MTAAPAVGSAWKLVAPAPWQYQPKGSRVRVTGPTHEPHPTHVGYRYTEGGARGLMALDEFRERFEATYQ